MKSRTDDESSAGRKASKRRDKRSPVKKTDGRKKPQSKPQSKPVKIRVTTHKLGGGKCYQIVTAHMDETEMIEIEVKMSVRLTDAIVISPIRRDLSDTRGLVRDAARIANSPLTD